MNILNLQSENIKQAICEDKAEIINPIELQEEDEMGDTNYVPDANEYLQTPWRV